MYHKRPWYRDPDLFANIGVICMITLIMGAYLFGVGFSPYMQLPEKIVSIGAMTVIMIMWGAFVFADYLRNERK